MKTLKLTLILMFSLVFWANAQTRYFGVFANGTVNEVELNIENKDKAFEILDFEVGIENTSDKNNVTIGGGKSRSRGIIFTKYTGLNSSHLLSLNLLPGKHFDEFKIIGVNSNQEGIQVFITYSFKLCMISAIDHPTSEKDDRRTEKVRMEVGAMKIEYWPILSSGGLSGTPVTTQWSFVLNNNTFEVSN